MIAGDTGSKLLDLRAARVVKMELVKFVAEKGAGFVMAKEIDFLSRLLGEVDRPSPPAAVRRSSSSSASSSPAAPPGPLASRRAAVDNYHE